jgi:hypothetical protein
VVIQQHSRKLLMMDILMSETCWAHKKWNKIASDIKLVFHSSTITMMHGPINIRFSDIHRTTILTAVLTSARHDIYPKPDNKKSKPLFPIYLRSTLICNRT